MDGSIRPQRLPRMHGHGKKVRTLPNGQHLEAPPSEVSLFQSIHEVVPIRRRSRFHGKTLEISILAWSICIQRLHPWKCAAEKSDHLETEQQQPYMQWIEKILDLDRRICKDPRLYCAYCDMSNHPRFSCKHVYKHRKPNATHRCTLCAGRDPPFLCPKAQVNGGDARPNWYKIEYKRAKQECREPDYRWGADQVTRIDVDFPVEGPQCPAQDPQPQCAAAAMMHGVSRPAASSMQGGCPTIAEHQAYVPPTIVLRTTTESH